MKLTDQVKEITTDIKWKLWDRKLSIAMRVKDFRMTLDWVALKSFDSSTTLPIMQNTMIVQGEPIKFIYQCPVDAEKITNYSLIYLN